MEKKTSSSGYSDPEMKTTSREKSRQMSIELGEEKFKRLGWKKLTVCLIVEAIALGSLSIPSVFRQTGLVAGIILCVGLGFIAIYTSYLVGQVKLLYPEIEHYHEAVALCWGKPGKELAGVMFVLLLVLLVGGHTLTGTIAWIRIVNDSSICALVWGVISALILFVLALPPSFAEFAILGYIDFGSIICAIGITIIATGVTASKSAGGLSGVDWSVWPPPDADFQSTFLSVTNIIFAYSFAVCQFSFMSEMHTPKDYVKSIWALGLIEIFIYTITGCLVYVFVGNGVDSPAILSAGFTVSRVAFGIALPVIFISGSINTTVVCRYMISRMFRNSPIKYTNTKMGWIVWISFCAGVTLIAWVIAEAVPFFNDLLGLISSLFISGFTFYFPALFWFVLIREGPWYKGWYNICLSIINGAIFLMGLAILGCGAYASAADIANKYSSGQVGSSFTCSQKQYT